MLLQSMTLLNTSKNKRQSLLVCPPRTRGQGGRHGLEWARLLAREAAGRLAGIPKKGAGHCLQPIDRRIEGSEKGGINERKPRQEDVGQN